MKKALALTFVIISIIFILSACRGKDKALTVNGIEVDQAEFAFYLNFNRLSMFSHKSKYTKQELDQAKAAAIEQIVANETVRAKCKELNLTLSDDQLEEISRSKSELISSIGGKKAYKKYLKDSCLTDRGYLKLMENGVYYELLRQYVISEKEGTYTDDELRQFFAENYICVKYIRLSCLDDDGNPKTEKEMSQLYSLAEEVCNKAQSTSFDTLIFQYSDDVDLPGGAEGLIVSVLDAKNQIYLKEAFDLAENAVSGIIEDGQSLYIVKRLPLDDGYFDGNQDHIRQTAADVSFSKILNEWKALAIVKAEKVIDKINFTNLKKYVR